MNIRNRLEILPNWTIAIPGNEATSSMSSLILSQFMKGKAVLLPVADALKCVPGSRVVRGLTPMGQVSSGFWFELPSGPPPNSNCEGIPDWYGMLRACVPTTPVKDLKECASKSDILCYSGNGGYKDPGFSLFPTGQALIGS